MIFWFFFNTSLRTYKTSIKKPNNIFLVSGFPFNTHLGVFLRLNEPDYLYPSWKFCLEGDCIRILIYNYNWWYLFSS